MLVVNAILTTAEPLPAGSYELVPVDRMAALRARARAIGWRSTFTSLPAPVPAVELDLTSA